MISEGRVDIYLRHKEEVFLLQSLGVGSNFGAVGMMKDETSYSYIAKAKTPVTVQILTKETVRELSDKIPELERIIKEMEVYIENIRVAPLLFDEFNIPISDLTPI